MHDLPLEVGLCVTNRATAGVVERARKYDVAVEVLEDPNDATHVLDLLRTKEIDVIALAGYLRRIPTELVTAYRHRILNIHPALLPSFGGRGMYGMHVHRAVIESGVRWTGVTIHMVDEEYDTGPIVLQSPLPVLQEDTPESLAARVLELEHHLYPIALRLLAQRRLHVDGRRVVIVEEEPAPETHHRNP